LAFSRDPIGAIEDWSSLGDVVRLEIPGQTMYLVTGPEPIKQILVDDHETFTISRAQRETFRGIEDHAVTTTTGDRWERLRTALRPAFTRDAMQRYADRIVNTTATYIDQWDDREQIDLYREMRLLSVRPRRCTARRRYPWARGRRHGGCGCTRRSGELPQIRPAPA
jgi:cytochrome P450